MRWAAAAISLCLISGGSASAASSSVGLSITFERPPVELIRSRGVAPRHHRTCQRLRAKIALLWQGRKRPPVLNCRSEARRPIIVMLGTTKGALIARP